MKSFILKSTLIIIVLLLFTSCSKKGVKTYRYSFKGEGQNWIGELNVDTIETFNEIEEKIEFILTYKGSLNDLTASKKLIYKFEHGSGGGGSGIIENPKEKVIKQTYGTKGSLISEASIIKVRVELDDKIEMFELKNVK